MLRVRDIMTTDVFTVSPETTVREAMEMLGQRHVGGAPVVSGGKVVGVVSGTDLMAFAAALSGVPTERDAGDYFSGASIADEVETETEPGSEFFSELWDDAGTDVTERMTESGSPEWNALEEHDVSEVMTRSPLTTIASSANADAAADLMRQHGIHRVLVTEGDKLVGVVSALDIATAAADHQFTTRTYVFNAGDDFDRRA